MDSPAKRKVIVAGRRGGKTTGLAMMATLAALAKKRVLYAAPKLDQTEAFWDACKHYFSDAIAKDAIYTHGSKRLIEMPGGNGRIRAKTAHDADTLRSDYADLLILDEYSLMNPDAWQQVGAPMMLDTDGDAVFCFTPKKRNHAYAHYVKGIGDDDRWQSWHFTSHDNPHLSEDALKEITSDMSDRDYRQEILAEFLDDEGAVFRNIAANLTAGPGQVEDHQTHRIVAGADWGKSNDYTAVSIGCVDCMRELHLYRSNKISYTLQAGFVADLVKTWNVSTLKSEANSMGSAINDILVARNVPVHGFQTTASSKPQIIESLALSLERAEFAFLPDVVAKAELEAYEAKVSKTTGRTSYNAPQGMHDDTVIARALMLNAVHSGGNLVLW